MHCVYLFKEAQKCYAKLINSYEKTEKWLITSGLFVSDINDKNVCLMHLSNNPKELCPHGWKYNGKLDTEKYDNKNINICCNNL